MVESVEKLAPQLEPQIFADGNHAVRAKVQVERAWSDQRVASHVPEGIVRRNAETTRLEPARNASATRAAGVPHASLS